jgi:hypothetical protein
VQGDLRDRQKIRDFEIRKEKEAIKQAEADEIAAIPSDMAADGASVEEICAVLNASRVPYSKDYIIKLVEDAKKREEAGEKPDEDGEPGEGPVSAVRHPRYRPGARRLSQNRCWIYYESCNPPHLPHPSPGGWGGGDTKQLIESRLTAGVKV